MTVQEKKCLCCRDYYFNGRDAVVSEGSAQDKGHLLTLLYCRPEDIVIYILKHLHFVIMYSMNE